MGVRVLTSALVMKESHDRVHETSLEKEWRRVCQTRGE